MKRFNMMLVALLSMVAVSAYADPAGAKKLEEKYTAIAKSVNPEFKGGSALEGRLFFNRKVKHDNHEVACASCHTSNPADEGKNIVTGKAIKPLSPHLNQDRFNDIDKVEENFTKHCNDIIGTDCTAAEKANFIAFLLTAENPSKKK